MGETKVRRRHAIFGQPLTPGESRVWDLMCLGGGNKEIAEALKISVKTVKVHVGRILKKKGERSRVKLALSTEAVTRRAVIAAERAKNLPRNGSIDDE